MTTPKDTLEAAKSRFEYLETEYPTGESSIIEEITAAIPVAELHEEVVKMIFTQPHTDKFWARMHEIRNQLEALKP